LLDFLLPDSDFFADPFDYLIYLELGHLVIEVVVFLLDLLHKLLRHQILELRIVLNEGVVVLEDSNVMVDIDQAVGARFQVCSSKAFLEHLFFHLFGDFVVIESVPFGFLPVEDERVVVPIL